MAIIQNQACMDALKRLAAELEAAEDRAGWRMPEGRLNSVELRWVACWSFVVALGCGRVALGRGWCLFSRPAVCVIMHPAALETNAAHPSPPPPHRPPPHSVIERVYGEQSGTQVCDLLRKSPAVAIPIILPRLEQKDQEWREVRGGGVPGGLVS
jgi:hypothetical protein